MTKDWTDYTPPNRTQPQTDDDEEDRPGRNLYSITVRFECRADYPYQAEAYIKRYLALAEAEWDEEVPTWVMEPEKQTEDIPTSD